MERREFNNIDEAIEALDDIANIDYSRNVNEFTERQFYSKLLNNFMGIKNVNLTKEDREKYKAALRKKGLLKYSDWKSMQPVTNEEVTWKGSVEKGSLDAPVNLFSKLLEAEDDKKFDYIRDVVDEGKSSIGKDWLEKNGKVLKDLERSNSYNVDSILSDTQADLSRFVSDILKEKEEEKKAKEALNNDNKDKESEKFVDRFGIYDSADDAINAVKSINKIEYKKGKEVNKLEEKKFYNDILKNLVSSSSLEFNDDESHKYKRALESIGCKEKGKLNKLRGIDEDIELPVDIVNSILQSTKGDHYHNLKEQKQRVRQDERVKDWVEEADKSLELENYQEKLENELDNMLEEEEKEKSKKNLPVPAKKAGFFKKLGTRVAMIATAASALFGVSSTVAKAADKDDINVKAGLAENVGSDVIKEMSKVTKKDAEHPIEVKIELPEVDDFTLELQSNVEDGYVRGVNKSVVKSASDIAYTKTPDSHTEVTTKANEKANKADKVVINDDGSVDTSTNGNDTKSEEEINNEDDMEIVDIGVIDFDTVYTEPLQAEFVNSDDGKTITNNSEDITR